ncbi:MAG: phage polymerase-related protein [Gemmatimonadetes bacterium]|nr:phage polymerase-related protein [Gemmatimonadota bacterium]
MDARESLRRYLEQRRELGESELVLDTLSVEDALKLLGAANVLPREEAPVSTDWRAALRAAGGVPEARPSMPSMPAVRDVPAVVAAGPADAPRVPLGDIPAGIAMGRSNRAPGDQFIYELATLEDIAAVVAKCTRCDLYRTALNPVPGTGNPNADFMVVGEAPGADEDQQGVPFIGKAGQLLTKILAAINLSRDDVFIANVLKHRPPGNRNPLPDEVTVCSPYLVRQIELVKPKVILALGTFAAQTLLETKITIGKLRGQVHRYHGVPLIVTYHPAALLRNPAWKRPTWEDVQLADRILRQ